MIGGGGLITVVDCVRFELKIKTDVLFLHVHAQGSKWWRAACYPLETVADGVNRFLPYLK